MISKREQSKLQKIKMEELKKENTRRDKLKAIAEENLKIYRVGFYKKYDILQDVAASLSGTKYCSEDDLNEILKYSSEQLKHHDTKITVTPNNVVADIHELKAAYPHDKVAVLNFASARKAGGGFLTGAMAQEEALCYASTLYDAIKLSKDFYKNEKHYINGLYAHDMIYSPNVLFIRDSEHHLVAPVPVDVITSAAVNLKDLKSKNLTDEINIAELVMKERIERIIALAKHENVDVLILGAFGCGVFGNNPFTIAGIFKEVLSNPSYKNAFKEVRFAVFDSEEGLPTFKAFQLLEI